MEDKVTIPGEVKDRIVKETHARIRAYRAKGLRMEQALSELTPWLEEQDEIEGTWTYRETDLTLRFADGTQVGILLGREQAYGPALGGLQQAYGPPLGGLQQAPSPPLEDLQETKDLEETKGGDAPEEAEN